MEELNESMEVIHEPMKIIPGDHTYCLPNILLLVMLARTNLIL